MASVKEIGPIKRSVALRKIHRAYRWRTYMRPRLRTAIAELRRHDDETTTRLATAMEEALEGTTSPSERAWVGRIESLRERLARTQVEVSVVDFGTGPVTAPHTAQEMASGKVVTHTIADLCLGSSNPQRRDLLLLKLIRAFEPSSRVEMGTLLGLSGAYHAAALELNKKGKAVTLDRRRLPC